MGQPYYEVDDGRTVVAVGQIIVDVPIAASGSKPAILPVTMNTHIAEIY